MTRGDDGARMDVVRHLVELRRRLVVCLVATLIAFCVTYSFAEEIYGILSAPLIAALPPGDARLVYTTVVEPFFTYLKAALVAAVVLASPVIFYEIWAFVAPGLHRNERRWFAPVVISSVALFCVGIYFAHTVVFTHGFKLLIGYAGEDLRPVLTMGPYFSFATKFLLAFGAIFEMPLFALVLARIGVIDGPMLLRWWRHAIVMAVVVGAILTPPDVVSQLLMAGPIIVLYAVSIIVAYVFGKRGE